MATETLCAVERVERLDTGLEASCPYYHGFDILDQLPEALSAYAFDRLFVVTSPAVARLYGEEVATALRRAGARCELIAIPEGEDNKHFGTLSRLCEELVEQHVSKDSILLALGGGVIGNVVGLAAALIYRGIRFVEVPTTVMGQTDSTLSNKQAVNGRRGKNHFGVYYAPLFIWADRRFLLTEPAETAKGGLVEAVKNGLISNPGFLDYIVNGYGGEWPVDRETLDELIPRVIHSKLAILRRDPSEKRLGVILEYGHTFGHAIESLGDGSVHHGQAVGLGMCLAAETSHRLGLCSRRFVDLHYDLMKKTMAMDVRMPGFVTTERLLDRMETDNKKTSRGVRFVLLEDVGVIHNPHGDYTVALERGLLAEVIEGFMASNGRTRLGRA
jgi:3-dehydroquinate synthetase